MKKHAGKHLILDLHGVESSLLTDEDFIRESLIESVEKSGATILHHYFHHFGVNLGVTGIIALSESHTSIHSWPEWNYAAVDIFLCGICDPNIVSNNLITKFKPSHYDVNLMIRTTDVKNYMRKI